MPCALLLGGCVFSFFPACLSFAEHGRTPTFHASPVPCHAMPLSTSPRLFLGNGVLFAGRGAQDLGGRGGGHSLVAAVVRSSPCRSTHTSIRREMGRREGNTLVFVVWNRSRPPRGFSGCATPTTSSPVSVFWSTSGVRLPIHGLGSTIRVHAWYAFVARCKPPARAMHPFDARRRVLRAHTKHAIF